MEILPLIDHVLLLEMMPTPDPPSLFPVPGRPGPRAESLILAIIDSTVVFFSVLRRGGQLCTLTVKSSICVDHILPSGNTMVIGIWPRINDMMAHTTKVPTGNCEEISSTEHSRNFMDDVIRREC